MGVGGPWPGELPGTRPPSFFLLHSSIQDRAMSLTEDPTQTSPALGKSSLSHPLLSLTSHQHGDICDSCLDMEKCAGEASWAL